MNDIAGRTGVDNVRDNVECHTEQEGNPIAPAVIGIIVVLHVTNMQQGKILLFQMLPLVDTLFHSLPVVTSRTDFNWAGQRAETARGEPPCYVWRK